MFYRILERNCWLLKPILYLLSFLYKILSFFHWHLKKIKQTSFPEHYIISVDSLAFGGTGKTPAVIAIGRQLMEKGIKPAIVLRGYHSKKLLHPVEVKLDDNYQLVGDEALLIKRNLPESMVIIFPDRRKAIQSIKDEDSRVIILDDGFSSSYLKKDFSLLLINPEQPAYYYRYFFFMQKKVNRVVFYSKEGNFKKNTYNFELEGFFNACGEQVRLKSEPVVIFSALGDNRRFQNSIQFLKIVKSFSFPDHHDYSSKDLQKIISTQVNLKASYIVCSEKDWVKVENLLNIQQKQSFIYVKNRIKFNFPLFEEIIADVKNKRKMEKSD